MGHGFDQFEFLFTLISLLRAFLARQGKNVFVGSDQHIGIDPRDRRITVAPDVYVLPQPQPPAAKGATWYPWEHHNLVPTLVFEFVSRSNRKKDCLVAPDKYARLGVQELIIFEPWKHQPGLQVQGEVETFRVFRLDEKRQWRQVYGGDGPTRSHTLGLWLHETNEGKLLLTEDRWGKRALLTPEEMLQVEQDARKLAEEHAERAEAQAERARERAEKARERAEKAEAEAALLRARASLDGKAEAVLAVLAARGLPVTPEQEEKIRRCDDPTTLQQWLTAALSAPSTARALALGTPKAPRKRKG